MAEISLAIKNIPPAVYDNVFRVLQQAGANISALFEKDCGAEIKLTFKTPHNDTPKLPKRR